MLVDTCVWFWEAAPIITYTTGVILGSNFRYQNLEINCRILIKCARDDIARKLFRKIVTMKENKIQNFCIQFNRAWIENHLHVSSSNNRNMLSNATGWGFSACWIQIYNQICSLTTPAIQALRTLFRSCDQHYFLLILFS